MLTTRRHTARLRPQPWRLAQRGLTLVEMLVGLTLGLVVVSALLVLLSNASRNGQHLQRTAQQVENGRYAIELLRDELQLAGFFGEIAVTGVTWSDPDPCTATPSGYAAAPLTLPAPVRGVPAATALGCLSERRSGTDALVLRRLSTESTAIAAAPAATWHVQYSNCLDDPSGQPLVFSASGSDYTLRNRACAAANPVRAVVSQVWFVADCNRCGSGGDRTPTLKRMELSGAGLVETTLADGVEQMRFEYGFDTDGNGSPDRWLTDKAANPALPEGQWANVMALRIHLVTRSVEKSGGGSQTLRLGNAGEIVTPDDGYLRRVYSSTVRLVNPSAARESQ